MSDFQTVAADVEYREGVLNDQRLDDMAELWPGLKGSTLVFVSAPTRAERVAVRVSAFSGVTTERFAASVADWLSVNYHPDWRVVQALRSGVATHTGPMPRSIQRVMIRLFAHDYVTALVCTSTLIEGVNTSAKNVVIYDKKINKRPIDYFTFSNVRGRAGRMSRHYVGRVISYMSPPCEVLTEVDIPIDSQNSVAPLSSIVQLSEDELNDVSRQRLGPVFEQSHLSLSTIRDNKGFDPGSQIEAAKQLYADPSLRMSLCWAGAPSSAQFRKAIEFGFENLLLPGQRRGMNPNRLIGMLNSVRECRGSLVELVARQARYMRSNEDLSDVVSTMLAFQRNWMGFTIPSMLRALERIVNEVASKCGESSVNYEFVISEVENLFLPLGVLDLDEYGLPLPIALRFYTFGMAESADVGVVLSSFVSLAQQPSVRSELSEVELWIVDDVLAGLGVVNTVS